MIQRNKARLKQSKLKGRHGYRRGDLFDKRRKLMEAWTGYCAAQKVDKVLQLHRAIAD